MALSAGLVGFSGLAAAQGAPVAAPVAGLEEIVVTARRRDESVQDIPVAITALRGEELVELGANGLETIANRVPGIQAYQASPVDTQFFSRGVSTGALTFDQIQQSSGVGIYFSETSTDISGSNPNFQLFDMARAEVLRGPQGTLYGAGAMSGAIRFLPARPDLGALGIEVGASLSSTESGDLSQVYDATLNVPIVSDVFGMRLVGYSADYGGVIDNVATGEDDYDSVDGRGGRVSFRWQPNERFTADLMVTRQNIDMDGISQSTVSLPELQSGTFFRADDQNTLAELLISYDLGFGVLTSVSGFLEKDLVSELDVAAIPTLFGLPPGSAYDFPTSIQAESFSQELRLQSKSGGKIEWLVGVFYNQLDRRLLQTIDVPGVEAALGFPAGPAFGVITDRLLLTDFVTDNTQLALFGQIRWQATDKLSVAIGGRYFDAEQDTTFADAGLFIGGVFAERRKASEDGFNPDVNVSYNIDEAHSLYLQAARGFRLGGTNYLIPPGLCEAALTTLGYSEAPLSFESDSLWNYELGSKNRLGNGRATLNLAAYRIEWSDIQSTVALPCGYNFQQNLGSAHVNGAEAELDVQVMPALRMRASATFTDAKLDDAVPQLGVAGGERTPFTPRFAATIGADYTRPVGGGALFVSADAQHVGERRTGVTSLNTFELDSFTLANLRLGYRGEDWSAWLFANNLFDKRAELNRGRNSFATIPGETVSYARPRTIGLTVRRRF
jgi:outer membrane receptor protein involved in Fe transport